MPVPCILSIIILAIWFTPGTSARRSTAIASGIPITAIIRPPLLLLVVRSPFVRVSSSLLIPFIIPFLISTVSPVISVIHSTTIPELRPIGSWSVPLIPVIVLLIFVSPAWPAAIIVFVTLFSPVAVIRFFPVHVASVGTAGPFGTPAICAPGSCSGHIAVRTSGSGS